MCRNSVSTDPLLICLGECRASQQVTRGAAPHEPRRAVERTTAEDPGQQKAGDGERFGVVLEVKSGLYEAPV